MASQVVSSSSGDLQILEIHSYVRGYHAYMDIWTPAIGQTLLLRKEPTNIKDNKAVAVFLEDLLVGHVPFNLASQLYFFLQRDVNKGFAEVTGEKVNRGGGYGLEVPCVYRLYGPKVYINRMKELVASLATAGLI